MNPRTSARQVYQLILAVPMLCLIATTAFADTASFIDQKYYSLGGEASIRQGEPILIDTLDLGRLISWKEDFVKSWVETGIPVILDVAPGYDGHRVFAAQKPGDPIPLVWGNNDPWRNAQTRMIAFGVKGITFNTWNGYTEGYAAVPTLEFKEANYLWLKSLNALIP